MYWFHATMLLENHLSLSPFWDASMLQSLPCVCLEPEIRYHMYLRRCDSNIWTLQPNDIPADRDSMLVIFPLPILRPSPLYSPAAWIRILIRAQISFQHLLFRMHLNLCGSASARMENVCHVHVRLSYHAHVAVDYKERHGEFLGLVFVLILFWIFLNQINTKTSLIHCR